MTLEGIYNVIEAVWWIALGIFAALTRRWPASCPRKLRLSLAGCLILFGISDVIEVYTGAWWEPLGLLFFKGACLVGIGCCIIAYYRTRGGPQPAGDTSSTLPS
jgi:hypothetical protein